MVSTAVRNILILLVRERLYTSESDVYRRQILTVKTVPALQGLTAGAGYARFSFFLSANNTDFWTCQR